MKQSLRLAAALVFAITALTSSASDQPGNAADSRADAATSMPSVPVYKPPLRGAPQARIGGGTRGAGLQQVVLEVLVPDHAGLTTRAQPALYWYADSPTATHFEIALIDQEGIDPLLELEIDSEAAAGIQRLDLKEHGVSLQPGVSYQWSVALVADTDNRSTDLIASGFIERIEPDDEFSNQIRGSSGTALVNLYANEGVWYDALDTLSTLITNSPEDRDLQDMRTALLEQVGIELPDNNR
jgi:hypothetical protein